MFLKIFRNALMATLIPNLAWAYCAWNYSVWVSPLYVWPCTLIAALWYGYRAQKFHLYTPGVNVIAYEVQSLRVGWMPFLCLLFFGLLNVFLDPHASTKSPGIMILVGMSCWLAYSAVSFLLFPEFE